jgi:hypothetical protein
VDLDIIDRLLIVKCRVVHATNKKGSSSDD